MHSKREGGGEGRGLKAKVCKEKCEVDMEFLKGEGRRGLKTEINLP